jgi:hypothetical protein
MRVVMYRSLIILLLAASVLLLPTTGISVAARGHTDRATHGVPNLNVRPGCRQSTIPDCLTKEREARATLIEEWAHFAAPDKAKCVEEAKLGSLSTSYIGLLTCLQFKAAVKNIPAPKLQQ